MPAETHAARLVASFGGDLIEIDYLLTREAQPAPWVGLALAERTLWVRCDGAPQLLACRRLSYDRTAAAWRWKGLEVVGEYWLAPGSAPGPYVVPIGPYTLVMGFAPGDRVRMDNLQPGELAGLGLALARHETA
jgi:hypothetical protein